MKTKQEQIDKIQEIINNCYEVDSFIAAEGSEGGYIDTEEAAKAIVEAGYGDVSEYKAEIDMTKDDIKKALTCCSNPSISYCKDCPYANYGEFDCCDGKMCKDALNLITEQEKEIELLKMQLQDVVNHADTFLAEAQKFETENVKLKSENEDLKDEIIYLERKVAIRDNALKDSDKAIEMLEGKQDTIVKQAKIDVLNELKKRARTSYVLDDFILGSVVFSKDIDELIKEVEEQ